MIVVVVSGVGDAAMVVVSGFFDKRMTNFKIRDKVTAKNIKIIEEMQMIAMKRRCRHLHGPEIHLPDKHT